MLTIRPVAQPLAGVLPVQQVLPGEPYRLLHYVVRQEVEEGLLLFNVLTRAIALLSPEEAARAMEDPSDVPGLVNGWFAVPQAHDDRRLALEVRAVGLMLQPPVRGYRSFTIFTTTDCNARCFYCYEKGRSRIPMTEETAREVASWMLRHRSGDNLRLRWFGGEPLFNRPVITIITRSLRDAGVAFRSTMVSNGYLFNDDIVEEAVSLWNLQKVQITLDGTEEVYNRSKAFIHEDGSAYRRVIGNIRRLLRAGVRVNVRLNIGPHNAGDLMDLAGELGNTFRSEALFTVYSHPLFDLDPDRYRAVAESQKRLEDRLYELGFAAPGKIRKNLRLNSCMADDPASVTILPDGHVGKCEHFSESGWFTSIRDDGVDETVLEAFRTFREELDDCARCPLYPDCFRLVKCEDRGRCYEEDRDLRVEAIRRALLSFYIKKPSE